MGKLSEWIKKNVKDGADISEAEKLIEETTIDNIDSKEKALDFMKKQDGVFTRALHKANQEAIETHIQKYESEKLPEILKAERDKAISEANPELTEDQKKNLELSKKIEAMELKDKQREFAAILRKKGKEFNFDDEISERYAVYGENAESVMKSDHERIQNGIKLGIESAIKERYGNNPPPEKKIVDNSKTITRDQYRQMTPQERADVFKDGGKIVD